jgi:putative Mg2+ transporter-C (MgtC) family protein
MDWTMQLYLLYEVALAMLLGAFIGVEREMADKPAGFRTHMLVAGASALLVGLRDVMIHTSRDDSINVVSDPIRIVEAIVTGVSFIGAGTIFRRSRSEQVQGLTTAATILMSSAVGICVAMGQKILAVGVTLLALIILRGLSPIEKRLANSNKA